MTRVTNPCGGLCVSNWVLMVVVTLVAVVVVVVVVGRWWLLVLLWVLLLDIKHNKAQHIMYIAVVARKANTYQVGVTEYNITIRGKMRGSY